jgi:peptide/nickel transport system permease protein
MEKDMAETTSGEPAPDGMGFSETGKKINQYRRIFRILFTRKLVVFGLVILFITVIAAIFAPLIAPYDPYEPDLDSSLLGPTAQHWLGTDPMGRDTLTRIIYGARTSMIVGIAAVGLAAVVGMSLGMVAGYYGGIPSMVVMRLTDALMAFPMLLLAMAMAAMMGGGLTNVIIALTVGLVASYTRLMYGQVMSVNASDFILAERAGGASNLRIMLFHILPNCFPPLIVFVTLMTGSTILAEAGLSFIGVGISPPTASWGGMVNVGYRFILTQPILSFAPGVAIMLVVFAFNMVGDGLRDALDPRLRGTL